MRTMVQEPGKQLRHGGLVVDPLVASDQEGDGEGDGDQGAEHKGGERHQPELGAGQLDQAVIQPVQVHQRDENCQP